MARVSIKEKFKCLHHAHPEIYTALVELAYEAKRKGFEKYSLKTLYDVLRFQILAGEKPIDYKMDYHLVAPSFMPLYKKMIQDACPNMEGFFRSRKCRRRPCAEIALASTPRG